MSESETVTIEVLAEAKGLVVHAGKELKAGERAEMSADQAQRHVAAGSAKIVESAIAE